MAQKGEDILAQELGGTQQKLPGQRVFRAVPVLIVAYNRPSCTARLMESLHTVSPSRLYVSVDGPKRSTSDSEDVAEVRRLLSKPTWPTELHERFMETNQGSGAAVSGALDWFFSQERAGVVLEDDCLPTQAFFQLAAHFLKEYEDKREVWGITGSNTANIQPQESALYAFVRTPLTWGWASWADRWFKHQWSPEEFLTPAKKNRAPVWPTVGHKYAFHRHLKSIALYGKPDAWDYQFAWSLMRHRGVWAVSAAHLVENIGFDSKALNSHPKHFRGPKITSQANGTIPPNVAVDDIAERKVLRSIFGVHYPLWLNPPILLAKELWRNLLRCTRRLTGSR